MRSHIGNGAVADQTHSFPMVIRSFGMSWSIMGQFIATVILLEAAPTAFATIGYRFWIILICLTFVYGLLVYFFLPETKGMTLEDISVLFGDPVELSFEQALSKATHQQGGGEAGISSEKDGVDRVESIQSRP